MRAILHNSCCLLACQFVDAHQVRDLLALERRLAPVALVAMFATVGALGNALRYFSCHSAPPSLRLTPLQPTVLSLRASDASVPRTPCTPKTTRHRTLQEFQYPPHARGRTLLGILAR